MVFASKHFVGYVIRWMFIGLFVLTIISCAELGKKEDKKLVRPAVDTIQFETRDSLMNWHDETYKSYYGLKGPVEQLVINPVFTSTGERASDGWKLWFNEQGRLMRKQRLSVESEPEFETIYKYNKENHTLIRIVSHIDKKLWRSSDYVYKADKLVRVEYRDNTNNLQFRVKRNRQDTNSGWFEVQMPVEQIEMPRYSEFGQAGELVWSNKGDINNGLSEMYFVRTVDGITSSSVVNENTERMTGRGGYRYHYFESGLLKSVESYNAHKNRLFHVTSYKYDDLWLLVGEERQVKDGSVFNQVIPEKVDYDYIFVDSHGNWLERKLNYSTKHQRQSYDEKRSITYFKESGN